MKKFKMTKNTLFKKISDGSEKDVAILVRISNAEGEQIRHHASIRKLSTSEFMRRAALGRKADVDYETEIILALSGVTHAIRTFHAALVAHRMPPSEELMRPVILEASAAIQRIST